MKALTVFSIFALLTLLLLVPASEPVQAQYYYSYGYSYAQPVNYQDGNYHYHSAGYSSKGNWYPAGFYRWTADGWYLQNYGYLYPSANTQTPSYTPGWQNKLLDIAANRDKVEGRLRTAALDYQSYLAAVKSLGLEGNFRWQNYGAAPFYPNASGSTTSTYHNGSNLNLGSFGVNGNTLYGYSYSTIKDVYGDTNVASLYQQAARLTEGAQKLAGDANNGFQDLVGKEGDNRARVAEILAKAQAAAVALQAANPQGHAREETKVQVTSTQPVQPGATGAPGDASKQTFARLIQNKCAACHTQASGKKGGFDIAAYASMSLQEKAEKVWPRLITDNKDRIMPRNLDGSPGQKLTAEEMKLFFTN